MPTGTAVTNLGGKGVVIVVFVITSQLLPDRERESERERERERKKEREKERERE